VDSPCHEFSQADEGVRREAGWVTVVGRGGCIGGPVLDHPVPSRDV